MSDYGFSELECKIILSQIERRARYREEFLRLRTDPCAHSREAGYVFDPAIQRFMSMKVTQFEYFQPNPRTAIFGVCTIILPMLAYGYLAWTERQKVERDCRCGILRYRDRRHKFQ